MLDENAGQNANFRQQEEDRNTPFHGFPDNNLPSGTSFGLPT